MIVKYLVTDIYRKFVVNTNVHLFHGADRSSIYIHIEENAQL